MFETKSHLFTNNFTALFTNCIFKIFQPAQSIISAKKKECLKKNGVKTEA